MIKANVGLSDKNAKEISAILNKLLADEVLLYSKTRNYHWNVTGPNFGQLHKFFEDQYNEIAEIADSVAERVRQLGHFAVGTLSGFLKITNLTEGQDTPDDQAMIRNLLDDHETIIRIVRKAIDDVSQKWKDQGTADFLTGLMESHEKTAWMLRATLRN